MKRALITWSDRGIEGPTPSHQGARPRTDRGPVMRLLEEGEHAAEYEHAWVLTIPSGMRPAKLLAREMEPHVGHTDVCEMDVGDPSDYAQLFRALGPLVTTVQRALRKGALALDVLLSAGTPQAQTLWVILVQSGALDARMLQVIPAVFVPTVHPRAVREVRLDIDGFPEIRTLRSEVARLRAAARTTPDGALLGESDAMSELRARVNRVALSDVSALIVGETGTGKELVAKELHARSERSAGPFVAENCGAFAEGVLASELFGHEAGAFTGASARRRGLFEQAHGGTLFLDEVGEMSPRVQSTLLRVLQEGTLRRVGGEQRVRVDVRVVAATHRDLGTMVTAGTFREDLYYRLRGATLEVPPLRSRGTDVALLVDAFLAEGRARRGSRTLTVTPAAMRALHRYAWPGNVRELRAEVARWAIFCDGTVDVGDLSKEIRSAKDARSRTPTAIARTTVSTLAEAVGTAEREVIALAMSAHGGNLSRAARTLAIDRNTLKRKLAAAGLR